MGNDRTGNFHQTRTEPNLNFLLAEPNRTEPNRTRAIHEDLGRIIWSFKIGAQQLTVSVVKVDLISNFGFEKVFFSVKIAMFLSIDRSGLPKEKNVDGISTI